MAGALRLCGGLEPSPGLGEFAQEEARSSQVQRGFMQ